MSTSIGELCYQQKHCTNCPARQRCTIRPLFYDDDLYRHWQCKMIAQLRFSLGLLNFSQSTVEKAIATSLCEMDARRSEELRLYGPDRSDSST